MNWANRRTRETAAVSLNGRSLHAAHVFRARGLLPQVTFCQSENTGGDVPTALGRLRQRVGLQRFRCVAVLPENDYRFMVMEQPGVPPEERIDALRWRLTELLDYPPEQAVLDTAPIALDLAGTVHSSSLHVVAARRSHIERVADQFKRADLELSAIDISEMALRNVAALFAEPGNGVALAWFGEEGSGILFVASGELCAVRHLDPRSEDAIEALQGNDELNLERIELGLQRSLDHFERNFSGTPVSRLLLAPFAAATGLASYLNGKLSLPVVVADLATVLDLTNAPALADPAQAGTLLVTLGAALRRD